MKVRNKRGEIVPIQDLPQGIILTSIVQVDEGVSKSELDNSCFGYSSENEDGWRCLNDSKLERTKKKK